MSRGTRSAKSGNRKAAGEGTPAVLEVRGLTCRFNHFQLFTGIAFSLAAGDILQVRGGNGSGKTTLLRILSGLKPMQEGEMLWNGRPARDIDSDYFNRITYLGHRNGIKAGLTVRENLIMQRLLAGGGPDADADADAGVWQREILAAVHLADYAETPAAQLSSGQSRRLALTRLLFGGRGIWILDEPVTALDREGRAWFKQRLAAHSEGGGIAIIATHEGMGSETVADDAGHKILNL